MKWIYNKREIMIVENEKSKG